MPSRQTTILFGLLVLTFMAITAYKTAPVDFGAAGSVSAASASDRALAGRTRFQPWMPAPAQQQIMPRAHPSATAEPVQPTNTPEPAPAVLIGAGDIGVCGWDGQDKTANLIEQQLRLYPDALVFTAGDNAQSMGSVEEYQDCFQPSWGRFKSRIRPSPGNHDWYTDQGAAYFSYFGDAAGPTGLGYYSYDLGGWHIVSLNSNCGPDGCGEDSDQVKWLRDDLARNPRQCTLLYWHHPLWDSGNVPINPAGISFWQAAYDAHADIVINGHDHHYERLAPLGRDGRPDPQGIRPFVVGTGGAWMFGLEDPLPVTEARETGTYGVLRLMLYPNRYEWAFLPVDGGTYTDSGAGVCN